MGNSSFIYSVDEESVDIATPYMVSEGEPKKVDWLEFSRLNGNSGPSGEDQIFIANRNTFG